MTKLIAVSVLMAAFSFQAHAWPEKKFECKNVESLPANIYEFSKLNVGGMDVPYVNVTRHYKGPMEDGVVTTQSSTVKGIAVESSNSNGSEIIMLGSLRFEFTNGQLFNCKAP